MLSSTPMRARAGAVFVWLFCGVAHGLLTAPMWGDAAPIASAVAWLFPSHHDAGLWSGHWGVYAASVGMLLAIGGASFALGYRVFQRRDA
jgi:squalene cyclase